jgi:alkyl sulfatase BDS1-like metallo-beta-lactamase superfamily hydrolase
MEEATSENVMAGSAIIVVHYMYGTFSTKMRKDL